ncbi:General amino acid permease [Alternaria tenuissima]|uniref:General amino acid permease n=1 Tax=Alternaria tenuissima TaxID=119927 RepID=A0AB37X028_9PLEO|nr:amino acid permease/ SLC12A domain-containing protein [Alternaria alternata]OWY48524.1 amino-acid permease inda1 [Alternaria alternata]RYN38241.1 General amino acid permease [Alternaria tenuissima]RYN95902.1 General amino acid permease [Alternaria tenuissima]RYO24413.1 General amino acid permease [Alternaria tenuissima]
MTSYGKDFETGGGPYEVKNPGYVAADEEKNHYDDGPRRPSAVGSVRAITDQTHRKLKSRHIQLIGIGGTIGTALYVQIGRGLMNGGPGSLFLAFSLWCTVILAVTLSIAEMVTFLPISSPFIRFAGRFVDDAFGFAAGWNFFVFEAALVPFEIVACNVIIGFWSDVVPTGAIIAIVLVLYAVINMMAVKWYGETEFWAAIGKVLLIIGLLIFTFISMLGGNPEKDRYGFRYWKNPGSFTELYYEGQLGRFLGFLQCLIQASFTIAGPDYVSMAAGETENPRKVMPRAYNAVFYRLTTFFVLGSLAVGINVPFNDPELIGAFRDGKPGAAASPYVIAMNRLRIEGLPHVVNAGVLASAFSAGNSYVYCASRSLFGLALEGKAPKFLTKCTKQGVPFYCVLFVLMIALLSFLQLGQNSAVVLNWFVSLVTASQLINFSVMCFTFLKFYKACKVQGLDRDTLPYKGMAQPYAAWYGLVTTFVMTFVGGYTVFLKGMWDVPSFLFSYLMVFAFPVLFIFWKLLKRTKWIAAHEADLVTDLAEIEEYHRTFVEKPETNAFNRVLDKLFG